MLHFIDVMIPLGGGILLVACPEWFIKSSNPHFAANKNKLMMLGLVLIGVGLLYLIIILLEGAE
jgi:hypothetical protein